MGIVVVRMMEQVLLVTILVGVSGCGGPAVDPTVAASATKPAPHNGMTLVLPNGKGFAELVNEDVAKTRGLRPNASLVVYFLGPDKTTPLSPPPSDVSITLGDVATLIPLPATPSKKKDAYSAARFATKVGPYNLGEQQGMLAGTLDGESFKLTFNAGR